MIALLNVPWIAPLVELTALTLPWLTSARKFGLYGIWTRGFGRSTFDDTHRLSPSNPSTTTNSAIRWLRLVRF